MLRPLPLQSSQLTQQTEFLIVRPSLAEVGSYSVSNLSGSSPGFPGPQVSPVSGQEEKQCRYPAGNNNMADPVMNYAASLATASSPGTNIAAAAHFYQQQVRPVRPDLLSRC